MRRLVLFCALTAIVTVLDACAAPTAPTLRRNPMPVAQDDTGTVCDGWPVVNGRC